MMRAQTAAIVTVLALALALSACSPFGNGSQGLEIDTEFARTFNLFEGSTVRVAGVDVGRIQQVRVEPGGDRVHVRLQIDEGVRIAADASAVIVQSALLGERYVQLHPPYRGGTEMEDGALIPLERTRVPIEFEEAFESLNVMLEGLDRDEVGRLVTNLADVVDGQGESLGETIDELHGLIEALRQSDDDLVRLAVTLADLNETVGTRARAMAKQFEDLNLVAASLASDRAELDRALAALLRMTEVTGDLVQTHRGTLQQDLATLTQLGRTTNRNLDEWRKFLRGQAELFRHAERVIPDERNWLPVINHTTEGLEEKLADRLSQRLVGLCHRLEIEACADLGFWTLEFEDGICLPPAIPCEDDETTSLSEALEHAGEVVPELRDMLREEGLATDMPVEDPEARRWRIRFGERSVR